MSDNGNVFRDLGLQQRLNASLIDDLVKAAARARLQGDLLATTRKRTDEVGRERMSSNRHRRKLATAAERWRRGWIGRCANAYVNQILLTRD